MTASLKSVLPLLGRLIGVSPNIFYERQKVLMQEGLLPIVSGRGPGSGTSATPDSLALLLIAFLGNINLANLAETTERVAAATPIAGKKCPFTGKLNFKDALATVLSDRQMLALVTRIKVSGSHSQAEIHYRDKRREEVSAFDGHSIDNPGRRYDFSLVINEIPDFAASVAGLFDDASEVR